MENRPRIVKIGLKPTCHTAVWMRPEPATAVLVGHGWTDLPNESLLAVCLGTTPSTAWALSGALSANRGESWDLWEVEADLDDEVHYRPHFGRVLDEVRITNRIPKSRCWLVGTRTVGSRRSVVA
jgi:hypothetical protein